MKNLFLVQILFLLLCSCQDNKSDRFVEEKIANRLIKPVLIDTFKFDLYSKNNYYLSTANYFPLYFGIEKDTIVLDYSIIPHPLGIVGQEKNKKIPIPNEYGYHKYFGFGSGDFLKKDSGLIKIIVDTNQLIPNLDIEFYQDSIFAFKANPVLIENKSNKNFIIGRGRYLSIIKEAIDSTGIWKPIEKQYRHPCLTTTQMIILPSREIIITSTSVEDGDFKTKLRLKIGDNYSTEFTGTIKHSQFENYRW